MARSGARRIEFVDDELNVTAGDPTSEKSLSDDESADEPVDPVAGRSRSRRRRYALPAGAVLLAGVVLAGLWWDQNTGAIPRDLPGVVADLSSPPVLGATVDVDRAMNLFWLGEDLMTSRDGAIVGLDPATGAQRWSIDDVGEVTCAASMASGSLAPVSEVSCVTRDGTHLLTVAAGGTLTADVALGPADAWTMVGGVVFRARWVADAVEVNAVDATGAPLWSQTVATTSDTSGCETWAQDEDTGEWNAVPDEKALQFYGSYVYQSAPVSVILTGCGVNAELNLDGEIAGGADLEEWYTQATAQWYTDNGVTLRVLAPDSLSEASTEIMAADGSVARVVPGQVLVPASGDGSVTGWFTRRPAGLTHVDEDGRQLWAADRLPTTVMAALASTTVVGDRTSMWALDTMSGAFLWEWDPAAVTTEWPAGDEPPRAELAGAFTDGKVVAAVVSPYLSGYGDPSLQVTLVALDAVTGRELWQLDPQDGQFGYVAVNGHLVGLGWDDANDGLRLAFYG